MALFHFSATQIKRSAGQSAIACAAYRAGEKLFSDYYGEYSDYTKKGGVIFTEIQLPANAPPSYSDRATLWNAVEKSEKHPKAQLAYSFDIALQNELSMDENIELARQFVRENFVVKGMIADLAVHVPDKEGGIENPHFHVMTTMRPLNTDGTFGPKQHREYVLDESGNRLRDDAGNYIFNAVHTTDWHEPETLEHWRAQWCKAPASDPFDMVSGTTGLMGCADSTFVMRKEERLSKAATLDATGRDIENLHFDLRFSDEAMCWEMINSNLGDQGLPKHDAVLKLVRSFMDEQENWYGTASELLQKLLVRQPDLDLTANVLVRILNAHIPFLRNFYKVNYKGGLRKNNTKFISLQLLKEEDVYAMSDTSDMSDNCGHIELTEP